MVGEKTIRIYWSKHINLTKKGFDSVDEFMEKGTCFACGLHFRSLDRAHIIAKVEGGNDNVNNLHMLCDICHKDSEYLKGTKYWEWFYERTPCDMFISMAVRRGLNAWTNLTTNK